MANKRKRVLLLLIGIALLVAALVTVAVCLGAGKGEDPPPTTPQTTPQPTTPEPTTAPEIPFGLALDPDNAITLWEESLLLSGTADPRYPLTVDGQAVAVSQDGSFSCRVPLELGSQSVELRYQGRVVTYRVERRYVLQSVSPGSRTDYHAGQTMPIQVRARKGTDLTVMFQGKPVAMQPASDQRGRGCVEGFLVFEGQVTMPEMPQQKLALGKISVSATCDGITETYESPEITCQAYVAPVASDPSVTPAGYWDVGSGYIVEIINGGAETFSGRDNNDRSDPTNNYLPEGTVDYASQELIVNTQADRSYRALRCGVRVYADTKNTPMPTRVQSVDCYYGKLPDHNEISLVSLKTEGRHTYLTLDCLWKAPFFFDYEEQEYQDVQTRKYFVERFDARYIDITFCYADRIGGELNIAGDHPLFQRAEVIKNTSDYTLRLWLKQEGAFYGWDAWYNEKGQLVFRFLNPAVVKEADNRYGADLTGVVVMLDVGHGGRDIGAAGRDSQGISWPEADRNLALALEVKAELEKTGATVLLNRTDNHMQLTQRERVSLLRQAGPDYCLAIHHNSSTDTSLRGYEADFFTTWSQQAAWHAVMTTRDSGIYPASYHRWHVYYVARATTCPVVLTENGYMSNRKDLELMLSEEMNHRKAVALSQAVVNYFLETNGLSVSKG